MGGGGTRDRDGKSGMGIGWVTRRKEDRKEGEEGEGIRNLIGDIPPNFSLLHRDPSSIGGAK